MGKKGTPIKIDSVAVFKPDDGGGWDVHFVDTPPTAGKGKGRGNGKGKEAAGEFAGLTDTELLREITGRSRSVRREFEGFLGDGGRDNRRRRQALEAEARRRGLDAASAAAAAAKAADHHKQDVRSEAMDVFSFAYEDEQGERDTQRYCSKSSLVRPTKKNYGQLGISTRRSTRHGGHRKPTPIPTDRMYTSNQCSTISSGHQQRILAIGPEEAENENFQLDYFRKRRKAEHDDSSFSFQKAKDVVLLDDEDVQPEEPVDSEVPDEWTELKIYYPSRDDPEAVELTSSDIKCLDPGVYLSSPVINYYIQYIKKAKLHDEDFRDKFHIFNTYFYSKLREALLGKVDFSKFRRWWKGVNIFHKGYIILPIHGTAHWSLIVICILAKESSSGPIILHLDSLGMHPSAEIFDIVGRFLEAEWCHLRKNPPTDISISEAIWEDLPRNIHNEIVQVPQQKNAYDCGIFMLYYVERFIREAPERFSRDELAMFSRSWFKSEDASELRERIRALLLEEFESARLDNAMSEADTSDRSDDEYGKNCGESEAATLPNSTEMIVEGGDTGTGNKDTMQDGASEQTPSSICRSNKKIDCVLSEAATFSDSAKDEEDSMRVDCDSSKTEQEITILSPERLKNSEGITQEAPYPDIVCGSSKTEQEITILSPERPKNNEGIMQEAPYPNIVCDSCDSDMDEVEILEVRNRRPRFPKRCLII